MSKVVGKRFNKLTFIKQTDERRNGDILWELKCDCGNITRTSKYNVVSGNTKSCGCLRGETLKKMIQGNVTHGMSKTNIYKIWDSMKWRCSNPKADRYIHYGGKGIRVCEEWLKFEGFYKWAKESGYKRGLSIDRINPDKDYEPNNCRWIPLRQQAFNKTNTRLVLYKGKQISIGELAEKVNKPYHLIYQRIVKLNWEVEKAVQ